MITEVQKFTVQEFYSMEKISLAANYYRQQAETASFVRQVLDAHVLSETHYYIRLCIRLYQARYFYDKFDLFEFTKRVKYYFSINREESPTGFNLNFPCTKPEKLIYKK